MPMPSVQFDRYYKYEELMDILRAFASENPELVEIRTIGQSQEGRDIPMAVVTDRTTGLPEDKPGFWCDGNIHASELSASTAVLKILNILVNEKPDVLKSRTMYLVPRLNPDGAEWALEDPPRIIRSGTRAWPFDEDDRYGIERKDMDGDGRILSMRIKDDNGPWKISEKEPRLMVKRGPDDKSGEFYRIVPEGEIHNYDGLQLKMRKIKEGLDFNRNFPAGWRQEREQHGAGPFPTSEPEIRAAVKSLSELQNICGAITFHTFSGVFLRPFDTKSDDEMAAEDLWTYKAMGKQVEEMTGYPAISVFHDFKYHPKEVITGAFDEWAYDHRGIYTWTCEIWSPQRQAGITDYKYIEWFRDHPHEDDIALLKWSDEQLDGKGYVNWYEFDHPQLGKVEIGGWDSLYAFRNPPSKFLEKEVEPLAKCAIWQAGLTPKLELREQVVEKKGDHVVIKVAVQNTGWLPTTVTKLAEERKLVRGVTAEIKASGSTDEKSSEWLIAGELRTVGNNLRGYNLTPSGSFGWSADETTDVAVFEWVVTAGQSYDIVVSHQRAGKVRLTVEG